MNASHLHLLVNHLPFATFLFALAGLLAGWVFKCASIKRFALCTMAVAGAIGTVAYLSGEAAHEESFGESSPFHAEVERHEQSAEATWIVGAVVGFIGLVAALLTKRMSDVPHGVVIGCMVATIVCLVFFMKTANLGGQIRHSEIRSDAVTKLINPRN